MKGAIRRLARERREVRNAATVPTAWLSNGKVNRSWNERTWLSRHGPGPSSGDGTPMLVMLGADVQANAALRSHAAVASRVYALVGSASDLQGLTSSNVLARRVPEVPVSALHSSTDNRAWIGGGIWLRLDVQQAEALRQTFLRLFWHDAVEEAWLDGGQLVWRPTRERPFDVPEVPGNASIRLDRADASISRDLRGARVHFSHGEPPAIAPRTLWIPAGAKHQDRLAQLVRSGADVRWDELGLPDLAVDESSGEALLPGSRGRLRIHLTGPQAREVCAVLDDRAEWNFRLDPRLGDPDLRRASFWLAGAPVARPLEEEQSIDLSNVQATTLRNVPMTEAPSWTSPQPLALSVLYRWSVVPPQVPAGSEEDPLVKRWRAVDADWQKRLQELRTALESSDGERSRLGKAFSRLLAGLLGFERTHRALRDELGKLESQVPSNVGPTQARDLLSQLAKLENDAKTHRDDLEQAERKAREEEELEKQRAEWVAQVDRAKREADQARKDLEAEERRAGTLAEEARDVEARSKEATPEEQKDLDVKQKRNSDDRKSNERQVKRLQYDLKRHEEVAARPFKFNPPKTDAKAKQTTGGRFVPSGGSAPAANPVPEDALPEIGLLRTHKGQRYLVISDWEQLEAGEKAATRLNANLVAPEDV